MALLRILYSVTLAFISKVKYFLVTHLLKENSPTDFLDSQGPAVEMHLLLYPMIKIIIAMLK